MANKQHLAILDKGVSEWNRWRRANPGGQPNLRKADLRDRDLRGANFNDVNLRRTKLDRTLLDGATFRRADLRRARLKGSSLRNADLSLATLVDVNLDGAVLDDCRVYGVSAWNLSLEGAVQRNLIVTRRNSPELTVDDLEVAQFVHLVIRHQKIGRIISTMGQKAVLILGQFSPPERKHVLDTIAEELRRLGLLPIMFDFEAARERDFTETVKVLAGLSLFVIADITNPRSAPLELQATVPDFAVPFVALLEDSQDCFSMYSDLANKYDWVLKPVRSYRSAQSLANALQATVVTPALQKAAELMQRKAQDVLIADVEELARRASAGSPT